MKFVVEFSTGARQDLLKIYHYIKSSGRPETAKDLLHELSRACASLEKNPERGPVPAELEGMATLLCRQVVIKGYRVIYQVIGRVVVIHGVIDGRRHIREALRQRLLF